MNLTYKNKYGCLEIEIVGPYQKVSTIRCKDIDERYSFDMDTAKKIALITENNRVQLCFSSGNLNKVFLVHHQSSSMAAVCKIVSLDFDNNINARSELARPNPFCL
jgi:hypothetical protein